MDFTKPKSKKRKSIKNNPTAKSFFLTMVVILLVQFLPVVGILAVEAAANINSSDSLNSSTVVAVSKTDFSTQELPVIKVEVEKLPRINIFGIGTVHRQVTGIDLIAPDGTNSKIDYSSETNAVGLSTFINIEVASEYLIQSGKYSALVTVQEDDQSEIITQDFSWGVLVMNPNKVVYLPDEQATVGFGMVDEIGRTVCNAEMNLTVTDPQGAVSKYSTFDGGIIVSEECGPDSYTEIPDYRAHVVLGGIGEYKLFLEATANGETHELQQTIEVANEIPFQIKRTGPSRIWPLANYQMKLEVTPHADYRGAVNEVVPYDFEIPSVNANGVLHTLENKKILYWEVDWKAGETYELSYEFDAPDVSPALFSLGPLVIADYRESRQWQIASDALVTPNAAVDADVATPADSHAGAGRNIVYTNETTAYLFYLDATGSVSYSKSTNGGLNWGSAVAVTTQTDCIKFTIWYDQWTPGDTTGGLIHVAFMESGTPEIDYNYIDTKNSDTQKSAAGVTAITSSGPHGSGGADTLSIARATNGALYIAHTSSVGGTTGIVRYSTDTGTNWYNTSEEGLDNEQLDYVMLMPLVNDDIMIFRWDTSADDIQSKEYENGANTWDGAWTNVDTSAVEDSTAAWTEAWAATINPNTYAIYLAYVDNAGTASTTPDIRTASYDGASWTAKTNVLTNINTILDVSIALDTLTDNIYVSYLRGTTTANTAYYQKSTDAMTTWNYELGRPLAIVATDMGGISSNLASPYEIAASAYDDTLDDIWYGSIQDIGQPSGAISLTLGTAYGANLTGFENQSALDADAATGTYLYSTSVYRSGAASLRTYPNAATGYVTYPIQYNTTSVVASTDVDNCGMMLAFRVASGTVINQQMSIIRLIGATVTEMEIAVNADQTLSIINDTDANGSFALVDDTWYVLAVTADSDAGAVSYSREVIVGIYSSDMSTLHETITQNQNVLADLDQLSLGPLTASSTADLYFDDMVISSHVIKFIFDH